MYNFIALLVAFVAFLLFCIFDLSLPCVTGRRVSTIGMALAAGVVAVGVFLFAVAVGMGAAGYFH